MERPHPPDRDSDVFAVIRCCVCIMYCHHVRACMRVCSCVGCACVCMCVHACVCVRVWCVCVYECMCARVHIPLARIIGMYSVDL